jgi:hemin uptake protein HemP
MRIIINSNKIMKFPQDSIQHRVRAVSQNGAMTRIQTAHLFGGKTAIEIEHMGQIYRLQVTRQGKLILTK